MRIVHVTGLHGYTYIQIISMRVDILVTYYEVIILLYQLSSYNKQICTKQEHL